MLDAIARRLLTGVDVRIVISTPGAALNDGVQPADREPARRPDLQARVRRPAVAVFHATRTDPRQGVLARAVR
jgi:hypothetical protein